MLHRQRLAVGHLSRTVPQSGGSRLLHMQWLAMSCFSPPALLLEGPCMLQALELEEFRALERQIIRETGPVLLASQTLRQSQSHLQHADSGRTMAPRQQGVPQPATPAGFPLHAGKQQPHGLGRGSGGSSAQSAQHSMRSSLQAKGREGGQHHDVPARPQAQGSIWQQARQAVAGDWSMGEGADGHAEAAEDGDRCGEGQDWGDQCCADNSRPELHATHHTAGGFGAGSLAEAGPPQGLRRVLQAAAGAQDLGDNEAAWEAVSQAESQNVAESTAGRQQQPADSAWVSAAPRHGSSLRLWPVGRTMQGLLSPKSPCLAIAQPEPDELPRPQQDTVVVRQHN